MGDALADGDRSASWEVLRLVPNGYLSRALNNDEVLLFVVMGVKGYADSGGRFEFEHEIRAARVTGGSLDLEPLSRSVL